MVTTALAGIGVAIAIPLVIKSLIDGPITNGEIDPVLPLGLLVLALGVLEAFLTWWRRWIQSNAVLNVETEMRRELYAHLQALPMSFHSRWQSGQLLSRATTDLSAIRRFFGFGMLFLFINILQVTAVTVVLLAMYWPLGLVVACTAAPIVWLSMRFEKEYVVVSRRVQDEQGDLATRAEEAAVAIRVIKSFGRSRYISEQYEGAARQLHATSMEKVRLSARFWTFLEVIPNLRRGRRPAVRCDRRRSRRAHPRRAGRVHHPDAVAGVAGLLARHHPRDGAGGDDVGRPDPRDLRHRVRHRERHPRSSTGPVATCASSTSTSRFPERSTSRCCATSTSTSSPARRSPSSVRPAPASPA